MINTTIADTLAVAADKIRYDEVCKQLLSEKIILAWIMKSCLEEYADLDIEDIASRYIEGTPEIGKLPASQDLANSPQIRQTGTEDSNITGQKTITRYSIQEENIFGQVTEDREKYDLLSVIMIRLGEPLPEANPDATPEEKMIRLLEVLFSPHIKAMEKKRILAEEYDIIITESIERLVVDMCNLSDGVEAIGIEKGIKRGLEQGLEAVTTTCKDLGVSFIDTVERIADKFNMTQQEAEEKVRKYW